MDNQLHRILQFAQSTGDKVIITDPNGKEPMVVMPFEMYEHLIRVGREVSDVSGAIDSLQGVMDAQVAPDVPMGDDLAIEPSPAPATPRPVPRQEVVKKTQEKPPELAKDKDSEEIPGEEQYYLEPVE